MTPKKLADLARIAAMIRDREMADLARHTAKRRALEDEAEGTRRAVQTAQRDGQETIDSAQAAEAFGRWAEHRQEQISAQMIGVQAEIDTQKQRTARAVGRHKNLEDIASALHDAAAKAAAKAP